MAEELGVVQTEIPAASGAGVLSMFDTGETHVGPDRSRCERPRVL